MEQKHKEALVGLGVLVAMIAAAVAFVVYTIKTTDQDALAARVIETEAEQVAKAAACRRDVDCVGDQVRLDAEAACRTAISGEARFGIEWTGGLGGASFPDRRWAGQPGGAIRLSGSQVRLQNGFGAWERHAYDCDFDPETGIVISVRVSPR